MSNHLMLKEYFKFFFSAKRRKGHGVHSPFVYELVSEVFNKKKQNLAYKNIEEQRKKLLCNNHSIEINDFGTGWRTGKKKHRKIAEIAKHSLKPKKQAQLLFRIIQRYSFNNILELGSSLGITSTYLAKATPNGRVISIEGCPNISNIALSTIKSCQSKNIELLTGEFSETIPQALKKLKTLDFVFFDGNHSHNATLQYFEHCLPYIHNNSIFVFDDIYLNEDMMSAWKEIKAHPRVIATIDIFYMGIVLFRKEMTTEHYKIRF